MRSLEERIRSGLNEAADRIPAASAASRGRQPHPRRPAGVWMGVAAVGAVLILFAPLLFLDRSGEPASTPGSPVESIPSSDVVATADGYQFANPEHVRLQFTQSLTLTCESLEVVDSGGFDDFDLDIWIDHQAGFARLGFQYPDGSTYDLILEGTPDAWEGAWGSGTDLGRNAGCLERLEDDATDQSIAGWAFQDSSELWFTAYLQPVHLEDGNAVIIHEDRPTPAEEVGPQTYLAETTFPEGSHVRNEFVLDEPELRVMGEQRYIEVPGHFEASAGIEVLESGPTDLPPDIFDTSEFTPLWGDNPVVTTKGSG